MSAKDENWIWTLPDPLPGRLGVVVLGKEAGNPMIERLLY